MLLGLRVCALEFSGFYHGDVERLSQEATRDELVCGVVRDQTPVVSRLPAAPVELPFISPEGTDVVAIEGSVGFRRCREIRLETALFVALENKERESKRERGGLKERRSW